MPTKYPSVIALVLSLLALPVYAQSESLRVVVTGIDKTGASVIASDSEPKLMLRSGPGSFMGDLWKTDALPLNNQSGEMPQAYELEPRGAGGVKFRIASIPPQKDKVESEDAEFGMHRTDTIDFITILSGEVYARMDSGQEVLLKPGDSLVQRGTNHAWINRGDVPCVFSAVMVKPAITTNTQTSAH